MPDSATALAILGGGGAAPPAAAAPEPTAAAADDPMAAKLAILRQGIAGTLPAAPTAPSMLDRLTGANGTPRYQTWPERLVRGAVQSGQDAASLPHDVMAQPQPKTPGMLSEEDFVGPESVGRTLNAAAIGTPIERLGPTPAAAARPAAPAPVAPADVLLTKGQQTGDLAMIREEQAALRGQRGDPARVRAEQFAEQQGQQVAGLKERIGQSFDQFGQTIAENPQDAAAMAQGAIQRASQTAKAGVNAGYTQARQLGGEVDARAFSGMGGQIRANLSSRAEPVIIDDQLTPWASKALSEVDKVGGLNIQNRANPPGPGNIVGVSLEGIEQARKRLVQMRSGAYASNATDGRATSAVLDAFDDHITQAINSGAFKGNPHAVQAWNDARAASAQFKQTFSAVKGDAAGQKIEKIIGRRGNDPLTPNDVADALYGAAGTNPGTTNVGVANRVKGILGDQSPEWSAVKQGLWRRLVEKGEGQPEMEPGTIATRLMKFLNADGREMANAVYSPQEREMIKRFAELQRQLQPPPTTVNRSETSTFVVPILKKIASGAAYAIGGAIAHHIGFGMEGEVLGALATGKGAQFVTNTLNARQISAQMPLATEAVEKFQKAVAAHARANSPPSRIALSTATTNLVRAFKPLGITFQGALPTTGSVPAAAGEESP